MITTKKLLFPLILILLALTACSQALPEETKEPQPTTSADFFDETKVTAKANKQAYSYEDTARFTIYNNSNREISYGEDYTLEKLTDGKWQKVDLGSRAVEDVLHTIKPGQTGKGELRLEKDVADNSVKCYSKPPFEPGAYRIAVLYRFEGMKTSGVCPSVYAEFILE